MSWEIEDIKYQENEDSTRDCSANFGNILATTLASVTCYRGRVRT